MARHLYTSDEIASTCRTAQKTDSGGLVRRVSETKIDNQQLSGVFVLLLANQREFFAFDHGAIDRDFGYIFPARHVVHDVEHDSLEHRTQRAGTSSLCH